MDHTQSWYIFLPSSINIPGHIISTIIILFFLIIISTVFYFQLRKTEYLLSPAPQISILNFFETYIEICIKFMKGILGESYKTHLPLIGTLSLFILFSNIFGLIPGLTAPTSSMETTLACGILIFMYFNLQGLKINGVNHLVHLLNPIGSSWSWLLTPLLFPIELISMLVKPFSLGMRLAANMVGDHEVLFAFSGLMPLIIPFPFFILGLMVSIIQTAVFSILSCVYISLHTQKTKDH